MTLIVFILLKNDLLKEGSKGNIDQCALVEASAIGLERVVQAFLEYGANPDQAGDGYCSPLEVASERGHEGTFELLVKYGANISKCGGKRGSAIQAAALNGHNSIVARLLELGADVNTNGYGIWNPGTPLQAATQAGHYDVVHTLLVHGGDVNMCAFVHPAAGPPNRVRNWFTGYPLQLASRFGFLRIVQLLLDFGAMVNINGTVCALESVLKKLSVDTTTLNKNELQYLRAFQSAVLDSPWFGVGVVNLHKMNRRPKRYGIRFNDCGMALHAASNEAHTEVVRLLLHHQADPNASSERDQSMTALHKAVDIHFQYQEKEEKFDETILLLIGSGATIDATSGLGTAF